MPDTADRELTEAERQAVKELKDFFQSRECIVFLRLLYGSIIQRDERCALIVDKREDERGWHAVIYLENNQEFPLKVTRKYPPIPIIGEFWRFDDIPRGGSMPSKFPISIEDVVKNVSERGVIPLDKIVDWICERLVSE